MKRYIEGVDRTELCFPERLEEYIDEANPVRAIEVFVEGLDVDKLGFERAQPSVTGRPAYHPATLLKLYLYGYLNRLQSSRRLERETQRNVELMWLLGRLMPDFKTIADFRKDNGPAIRRVCREFVAICRKLALFSEAIVAIDGSKFKAVNNRDRNFTEARLKACQARLDKRIARYLAELDEADDQGIGESEAKAEHLAQRLTRLKAEQQRLECLARRLMMTPDKQLSLTDPDARAMFISSTKQTLVGYNVQIAVESKHHLIVAHETINIGSDRGQLHTMARQAREAMGGETLTGVADRGYYYGEPIRACEQDGIEVYVPKPQTSGSKKAGRFGKQDFQYDAQNDQYRCPAGAILPYRYDGMEEGKPLRVYFTSACQGCSIKARCTPAKERRIRRWKHEAVLDRVAARLQQHPEMMDLRRQTVEHPFGTLKMWMGATHFLTTKLTGVRTEISLHVLGYNFKRVMNLLGVRAFIDALAT